MTSYDPELRRDTPLALELKGHIRSRGPMLLRDFLSACLWDEAHGYYATRLVLGSSGDFVTAPEISQVFGELLGLWSAVVWQSMGAPATFDLIELGPGRGTLMADALRALKAIPPCRAALNVTMVEDSPTLREAQRKTLTDADVPVRWTDWLFGPWKGPRIVLANEFLDVFHMDQSIKTAGGWRARAVGLGSDGQFHFTISPNSILRDDLARRFPDAPAGSILSTIDAAGFAKDLAELRGDQPFAALIIDYGHTTSALGDTLQAVRDHVFEHPLTSPGEADLTVQVDFADLSRALQAQDFAIDGPITQGEFLGRLGILERASRLMAANTAKAATIEAGVARLMAVPGMGDRFKVLGVRSPDVAPLPGF